MQQQTQLAQNPEDPGTPGEPELSWDGAASGEVAASALKALKKVETSRIRLQPSEERPEAAD
jgi:hypothetical protein